MLSNSSPKERTQRTGISFRIRDAQRSDMPDVASLYAHYVVNGTGTFEEVAPSCDEMARRFDNVKARGLPWRVADAAEGVIGYCYASPYHARSAYRFTAQSSVYVSPQWLRRGVGLALLSDVIRACEALGYGQIMAAIGDSRNETVLRVHAAAGYRTVGHALRVGVKFGRWLDLVYMQRALGDPTAPPRDADPQGYIPPIDQTGP